MGRSESELLGEAGAELSVINARMHQFKDAVGGAGISKDKAEQVLSRRWALVFSTADGDLGGAKAIRVSASGLRELQPGDGAADVCIGIRVHGVCGRGEGGDAE